MLDDVSLHVVPGPVGKRADPHFTVQILDGPDILAGGGLAAPQADHVRIQFRKLALENRFLLFAGLEIRTNGFEMLARLAGFALGLVELVAQLRNVRLGGGKLLL